MKQQQRMKIMKDVTKKIRSRRRTDAENRWCGTELLTADCEKAWIHPGWEETVQKWYEWLKRVKKEDEKENVEEMHHRKVKQMIKSAEGIAQNHETDSMERSSTQILEKEEEDAGLMDWCEAKRKNGQRTGSVAKACRMWRRSRGKMKNCRIWRKHCQGSKRREHRVCSRQKKGEGCDGFHPKVSLDLTGGEVG